ncbi:ATP-binding protein [Streptomyces sp. LN245]|uniref:ATP-binding protein n=1 Tax=Streptomyces sp. LN245 TaxID=3112975 RepID=UPI003720C708
MVAAGELLTNALRHGSPDRGDTITVGIECDPRELRVSVADRSSALPAARTAGGAEESGRGLTIIAALSDDWGIAASRPGHHGKEGVVLDGASGGAVKIAPRRPARDTGAGPGGRGAAPMVPALARALAGELVRRAARNAA